MAFSPTVLSVTAGAGVSFVWGSLIVAMETKYGNFFRTNAAEEKGTVLRGDPYDWGVKWDFCITWTLVRLT